MAARMTLSEQLQAKTEQLADAIEQQRAVSSILAAINKSSDDASAVFDAILASALRLCDGLFADVFITDGKLVYLAAHNFTGPIVSVESMNAVLAAYPLPLKPEVLPGRVMLEARAIHFPDVQSDPNTTPLTRKFAQAIGFRSGLFVPMVRDGRGIGAIGVARAALGPFSERQIQLLQTFADQAAMALDHTRLLTELEARNRELSATLAQQQALTSLLATVNQAPEDDRIVYSSLTDNAVRLCNAHFGAALRYDGERVHLMAHSQASADWLALAEGVFPAAPTRDNVSLRSVLDRAVVNVADTETDASCPESTRALGRSLGYRSVLAVPMLRAGQPVGAITVTGQQAGAFTQRHVALLQSFADHAVIAIDRAELVKELKNRTIELTRSVGELTALNEVGRALGSSLEQDVVLRTIMQHANRIGAIDGSSIYEYDPAAGVFTELASLQLGEITGGRAAVVRVGEGTIGKLALTMEPIQIADIAHDPSYQARSRESLLAAGFRALLAVPLIREARLIGGLVVGRKLAGPFEPRTVETLRTFAAQSALAIENARLFRELRDKGAELEAASRHKSEFLANMSHELRTPLNAVIGFSEALIERYFGELNDKQDEYVRDIHSSGAHLLTLINDILDLSKIEAGRMDLHFAEFDLQSALQNAVTLIKERAYRKGLKLSLDCAPGLGRICADEIKFKQIMLNLLSNAVKFTPAGGSVRVGASLSGDTVDIAVADTGTGIAAQDHDAVFEEFRQVGNDLARKSEGTGLGLPLAKRFAELHGGSIALRSAIGQGSTFTVRLPLRAQGARA
jgi:two-component system, NtrC family, sensor kinase